MSNSVQEYMVWRTLEGQLDWFVMQVDEYVALTPMHRESFAVRCSRFVVSSALSGRRVAKGAIGVAGRIEFNRASRLCAALSMRDNRRPKGGQLRASSLLVLGKGYENLLLSTRLGN